MMLLVAVNEIFLGIDIYLAHSISGTIVPNEWIPVIFGPIAGIVLLLAGLVALRHRPAATLTASLVCMGSIVVGLLGTYFHLLRAMRPFAPVGERVNVELLVWAPPVLGPLMFCLVGLLGMLAIWVEDPEESGVLALPAGARLHLPFSKTRVYLFIVGLAVLSTVISSVLDHARTGFDNPWLWAPTIVGVFATVVAIAVGVITKPTDADILTYFLTMLLLLVIGPLGTWLHILDNLTSQAAIVPERFIRGAPFLAPLLYANAGILGLIALLSSEEGPLVSRDRG
jgi:hypothetical protein